ncbi:hypothetical protein H6785_01220 [Candidatus Nomurabacteria bacterium]|nr:hypothetical protein [Candidatus Kaiserbacteria bacterium]MCB9815191.1 hypothetical protein [Candidatus Nomurabacteria bacterium]
MSIFQKIVDWNNERGLLEQGFDYTKEVSFIVEELLESTGKFDSVTARNEATRFATEMVGKASVDEEKVVDAFADIIVFASGAIAKLGYDPTKVMDEVYTEINSRSGELREGKFVKDPQAILYTADLKSCRYSEEE